jgi:ABC-2 type transport system ATP-binding protein
MYGRTTVMIETHGLCKRYPGGKDGAGLNGIDLEVGEGTVCGLLGPNGAGKTTAVRILSTLLRFDAGSAQVAGYDVRREAAHVRRTIGLVGQHAAVDDLLSGRQNLVMFARLNHLPLPDARHRADELLVQFGLDDTGSQPVSAYSGGMRRRLDLAAGLVVAPRVLFVDEPTTGLDPGGRREVWAAVRRLVDEGTTVLLTTQYLEEADQLADRIAMLDRGLVVAEGTPDQLKTRLGTDWIEVRLRTAGDADQVAALGRRLTSGTVSVEALQVRIPVADRTAALLELALLLREASIIPADIAVRRPTLDEVFLALTGGSSRTDPEVAA